MLSWGVIVYGGALFAVLAVVFALGARGRAPAALMVTVNSTRPTCGAGGGNVGSVEFTTSWRRTGTACDRCGDV